MGDPNPVRSLESHAVVENGYLNRQADCAHYMISIKTGSEKIRYVEQCVKCQWIDAASLDWWAEDFVKRNSTKRAQRIGVAASSRPFQFVQHHGEELTLQEILYQALGAASLCWREPTGAGAFDSRRALEIGEALEREVDRALKMAQLEALRSGREVKIYAGDGTEVPQPEVGVQRSDAGGTGPSDGLRVDGSALVRNQ